jgi:hypothetical protein
MSDDDGEPVVTVPGGGGATHGHHPTEVRDGG